MSKPIEVVVVVVVIVFVKKIGPKMFDPKTLGLKVLDPKQKLGKKKR